MSASGASGTSGTGPSTGSSVIPAYTSPFGSGMANTYRLRWPGTGTVSAAVGCPSVDARSTMWLPREGRRRIPSTSEPAQTPVALITARARTVNSSPVRTSRARAPSPARSSTRA